MLNVATWDDRVDAAARETLSKILPLNVKLLTDAPSPSLRAREESKILFVRPVLVES